MVHMVEPGHLHQVIDQSLALYQAAAADALDKGVIIADAAFEFGLFQGMVILIGECLTPDCARLWDADTYRPGGPQADFGRDYLLRYLEGTGWNHQPPAPPLPGDIVQRAAERYREAFRRLTGGELE
jgi:phosphoribosylaminoimidazole-succinocarboxamide synthase